MNLIEILEEMYKLGLQKDVYVALHSNFIKDCGKIADEC